MCCGRIYCPVKNAAAMQFDKRYNAMLLKQMYVEYQKGGKNN